MKLQNIFIEIPSLTEKTSGVLGTLLNQKFFQGDKRYITESLHRFGIVNQELLNFIILKPLLL